MEERELNSRIMQAFKDAEEARIRLLGVLAILVEDEIISAGRARELGYRTPALQIGNREHVRARTAHRVRKLYRRVTA